MQILGANEYPATLSQLKFLLEQEERKIHGVYYTNSFFSQRYLCRSHVLVDNLDIEEDAIKLKIALRLEPGGIMEVENTLDMLVEYEAGDLPGFIPNGSLDSPDNQIIQTKLPEPINVNQYVLPVDLLLELKEPKITFQDFSIAGYDFTVVNLYHRLNEAFEQIVTLLFGYTDKLYFFSHFFDRALSPKDTKSIIDLIVNENITGKAIRSIRMETASKSSFSLFPFEALISSYISADGDYVFGDGSGYIRIPGDSLKDYKMKCEPNVKSGAYTLSLYGKKDTIKIYME
jgi:hypothetical protein